MKLNFEKFYENSSIHGFKYLSKKFSWIEKIFWMICLFVALILTIILITQLILKVKKVPIIIYISDQTISVSEINFPAITACPGFKENMFEYESYKDGSYTLLYSYYESHTMEMIDYESDEYIRDFSYELKLNMSYTEILSKIDSNEIKAENLGMKVLKRLQVVDLMSKRGTFQSKIISIPTNDFLNVINEFNKEMGEIPDSMDMSWPSTKATRNSEIITEFGLCRTFNIAPSEDVLYLNNTSFDFNYDYIYSYDKSLNHLEMSPRRLTSSHLSFRIDNYVTTSGILNMINMDIDGCLIFLHDPYELPSKSSQTITVNMNQMNNVLIAPQLMSIDESLVDDDPIDRNCYLSDERQLKYFRVYTKANCENECMSDFMITQCGCVEFFMIRNATTRICSASEKNCYDMAKSNFDKEIRSSCGCMNSCEYIKYSIDIEQKDIGFNSVREDEDGFKMSTTNIKYKSNSLNELVRRKHFNFVDFLSFIGGLLGLLTGFSVLSLIEIIYWSFVKALVNLRKQRLVHSNELFERESNSYLLSEYLNNSSIHGVNYLIKFKLFDRLFWTFFMTISLTLCIFMVLQFKTEASKSLVIEYDDVLSFKENITFPTLTYLPNSYVDYDVVFSLMGQLIEYKESIQMLNDTSERKKLCAVAACQYMEVFKAENGEYIILNSYFPKMFRSLSQVDWFKQQNAVWNGKYRADFSEVMTSDGMVFSFNLMNSFELLNDDLLRDDFKYTQNNTSLDAKYSNNLIQVAAGDILELTLKIKNEKIIDENTKICITNAVKVHSPDFVPLFYDFIDYTKIDGKMRIEVTPEIIRTDKSLRDLSPEVRECYFQDERKLKYFKVYSQRNCELECMFEFNSSACQCQMIDQIFKLTENVDFCFYNSLVCEIAFFENFPEFSFVEKCSCLPLCNDISYHVKYIQEEANDDETVINVRMGDEIILFRRYQQLTFSDIVSNIGGLLGLFAGISMLSIVEIIYFLTIRICGNVWRYFIMRQSRWAFRQNRH